MSVLEAATEAANRIIHGDTNELVAGVLLQILAKPRWSSEFRTGTEWVPLDRELVE